MPKAAIARALLAVITLMAGLFCAGSAHARGVEIDAGAGWSPPETGDTVSSLLSPERRLVNIRPGRRLAPGRPWWLSRDPLGERGGLNLYGFVGNDPVNKVDYLGLDIIDDADLFASLQSQIAHNPAFVGDFLWVATLNEKLAGVETRVHNDRAVGTPTAPSEVYRLIQAATGEAARSAADQFHRVAGESISDEARWEPYSAFVSNRRQLVDLTSALVYGNRFQGEVEPRFRGFVARQQLTTSLANSNQQEWENGLGKFGYVSGHIPGALADVFLVNAALGTTFGFRVQDNVQGGLFEFIDDGERMGRIGELALAFTPFAFGRFGVVGREIALGKDIGGGGVKALSRQTGASYYRNWARDGITRRTVDRHFGRAFHQAVDRADKIHFTLDGIGDVAAAVRAGRAGFSPGNFTHAELHYVMSNPEILAKTIFYRAGEVVPSPF